MLTVGDEALEARDFAMAAQAYGHVLQDEPGHPQAVAGLARAYLMGGDIERAKSTLQMVRPDAVQDDAIRAVEAEIRLRETPAPEAAETVALRARLAADPKDHQALYDLAMALEASGNRDGAVDELLEGHQVLTVPRTTSDADLPGTAIHRTDSDRHSSVVLRTNPAAAAARPHPGWQSEAVGFEQLVMAYLLRPTRAANSSNPAQDAQPPGPTTKVMSR